MAPLPLATGPVAVYRSTLVSVEHEIQVLVILFGLGYKWFVL